MSQKELFVDLHIHTNASDGVFTPKEAVEYAKKVKLSCISITDHDSVCGIDKAVSCANGIEVIPGIELSSEVIVEDKKTEMHILGYYIDYKSKELNEALTVFKQARIKRAFDILEKLSQHGVNLQNKTFLDNIGNKSIGRLHFAKALVEEKFVSSIQEAFQRYLGIDKVAYVPKYTITPCRAIKLINDAGGVAVMAHPFYAHYTDRKLFESFIDCGLKGIEVWHTKHTESMVKNFLKLAQEYNLVATGGSDCHGPYKNEPPLMGKIKVPYSVVENLEKIKFQKAV